MLGKILAVAVVLTAMCPGVAQQLRADTPAAGPRALTLWWVIFNDSDACIANPGAAEQCGYVDVFGQAFLDSVANGTPDPSLIAPDLASELAVLYATGAGTMGSGGVRMVASIYKSEPGLDFAGPSVVDPMGFGRAFEDPNAEVHLVVRDHGAVVAGDLATQILNFLEPHCSDPNLGWFAGDNTCADAQFAIFAPGESGEDAMYALADPSQPLPSSRATLVRNGEMVQAIVETRVRGWKD